MLVARIGGRGALDRLVPDRFPLLEAGALVDGDLLRNRHLRNGVNA